MPFLSSCLEFGRRLLLASPTRAREQATIRILVTDLISLFTWPQITMTKPCPMQKTSCYNLEERGGRLWRGMNEQRRCRDQDADVFISCSTYVLDKCYLLGGTLVLRYAGVECQGAALSSSAAATGALANSPIRAQRPILRHLELCCTLADDVSPIVRPQRHLLETKQSQSYPPNS